MMGLTKVELRRFFSRRLTSVALLGALVITGMILVGAYQQAKPLTGAQMAFQRTQFDQAHKSWEANGVAQFKDCLKQQKIAQESDPKVDYRCNEMEPKWGANWGKPKVKFFELMKSVLFSWSYLMAFIGFLIGAGFVAAEFSTGSMGNWLTFEPRRMRVYMSKLAAAGLGLIPAAAVLLGLLIAGVWMITSQFGTTAGTTAEMWNDLGLLAGRLVALTVVTAVVGAAMGALLRHTAAVMGIAIGYLVLVEGIFAQMFQGARPWLVRVNMDGWIQHGTKYYIQSCKTDSQGNYRCDGVEKFLGFGHSSAYLGLLVVLVIGLSALIFQRRDVN